MYPRKEPSKTKDRDEQSSLFWFFLFFHHSEPNQRMAAVGLTKATVMIKPFKRAGDGKDNSNFFKIISIQV